MLTPDTVIATETTAAAVCAWLLERFDVGPEQCQADPLRFLHSLHGKGLVRIVE
jgi:hypothetical protein